MLKKYLEFIKESININYEYDEFMNIYNNKIVPKIGEVKVYKNNMRGEVNGVTMSSVLDQDDFRLFNRLMSDIYEQRKKFAEYIFTMGEFYKKSFSYIAVTDDDPEEDFSDISKLMKRKGCDLQAVKKLFDPVVCIFLSENFEEFISRTNLDSENGYIDLYLFKIAEELNLGKVWLGGEGWGVLEEETLLIRYSYGYHKTKYGQLYLEQIEVSKEDFILQSMIYMKKHMVDVFRSVNMDLDKIGITFFLDEEVDDFITIDEDRFIISYDEIYEFILKAKNSKLPDEFSPDFLKESIIRNLHRSNYGFDHLNVQDTGEELIVSK